MGKERKINYNKTTRKIIDFSNNKKEIYEKRDFVCKQQVSNTLTGRIQTLSYNNYYGVCDFWYLPGNSEGTISTIEDKSTTVARTRRRR